MSKLERQKKRLYQHTQSTYMLVIPSSAENIRHICYLHLHLLQQKDLIVSPDQEMELTVTSLESQVCTLLE